MATTVTLRRWQRDALISFNDRPRDDFLAVACPGAGKTTFALSALRSELGTRSSKVAVVVPTAHLKQQWATAAARFGLHLEPDWNPSEGFPSDMHGIVVTYAQASSASAQLKRHTSDAIVVLDEIHHAADELSWGTGVLESFENARVRLLLSGTPFRSDDNPIPFVHYTYGDHGEAVADYVYGYGEALADGGVVRPVFFPRFDGHMEWVDASGALKEATFSDELAKEDWGARLRTALASDGEWLPSVMRKANRRLQEIRNEHPNAGGLVIATDHEHAREIAKQIASLTGVSPDIILSDDPKASERIEHFANSDRAWVVAVRMISEGVDIARLRVGVFATTTTTALFFRQAVGRISRWTPGLENQPAYFYVPDDHRLRGHAATIAVERRHSVESKRTVDKREPIEPPLDDPSEQMSLFAPVSSTVLEEDWVDDGLDGSDVTISAAMADPAGHPFELPPPPPLAGKTIELNGDAFDGPSGTRARAKKSLREQNAERVRTLSRLLGEEHRAVNAELNRKSGVARVTLASADDLTRRLKVADEWLEKLTGR